MIFKLIHPSSEHERAPMAKAARLGAYIANPETEDGAEKCHWLRAYNLIGPPERVIEELKAAAVPVMVGKKLRTARSGLEHCVVSWPENETPSVADVDFAARSFVSAFDPRALCFAGVHVNTENLHLHLAIQRFGTFGGRNSDGEGFMLRWHGTLAFVERTLGFASEANPLVFLDPTPRGGFRVRKRKGQRSAQALRPVSPDLLPVIEGPPPPWMRRQGPLLWIPQVRRPILYKAENFLVVLQWQLPETISLVRSLGLPVHNVRPSSGVKAAGPMPMEDVPARRPRERKRTSVQADFLRLLHEERHGHESAREENAARRLLDMGYDGDAVGEVLERESRMPDDAMRPLHVRRAVESALRPVNRFRRFARFGIPTRIGPDRLWEHATARGPRKAARLSAASGMTAGEGLAAGTGADEKKKP